MFVSRIGYDLNLSENQISNAIKLVKDLHGLGPACAALNKQGVSLRKLSRLSGLSKNYIWRLSGLFNQSKKVFKDKFLV